LKNSLLAVSYKPSQVANKSAPWRRTLRQATLDRYGADPAWLTAHLESHPFDIPQPHTASLFNRSARTPAGQAIPILTLVVPGRENGQASLLVLDFDAQFLLDPLSSEPSLQLFFAWQDGRVLLHENVDRMVDHALVPWDGFDQ